MQCQKIQLFAGLDPFGDNDQPHAVRHGDDSLRNRRIARIADDIAYKRLVHFHLIDRQLLQIRQRRVASAEIVNRNAYAERFQLMQDFPRPTSVMHDGALGDFERDAVRISAGGGECRAHVRHQIVLGQLARGDIDADLQGQTGALPFGRLSTSAAQNPAADLMDQFRFLGLGDEHAGKNQTMLRVMPAQQRFHADHQTRYQCQLRLVVQRQLIASQCLAQFVFQGQTALGMDIVFVVVVTDAITFALLDPMQRGIGVLEQRFRIVRITGKQADTDAAGDMDLLLVRMKRFLADIEKSSSQCTSGFRLTETGQQNRELVAIPARNRVMRTPSHAQPCADFDQQFVADRMSVGVTTNPTIFASALAKGTTYDAQVAELAAAGASVTDAVFEITTNDVAAASDIFRPIYDSTSGFDGRVSIEVEPGLAHDAAGTIEQARQLWAKVDRPNAMIKIPATVEGLEAIAATIGAGISVNVTLIFSLERHREVIEAYLTGLETAKAAGIDLSTIHSVASFFVSRVDTEIDKRLEAIGTDAALALKSKAGIANAQLAYQVYEEAFATDRAQALLGAGANKQRPLWASTGV